MKRVANCILHDKENVLMLKKPKRGWWVAPGGKIEPTETIKEAVVREFFEETNLTLMNPTLKGVFNIIIKDRGKVIDEWMMFTFYATKYSGQLTDYCSEGQLSWKKTSEIFSLPKALGDNVYLEKILNNSELMTGKFEYTPSYELISYSIDNQLVPVQS